MVVATRGRPENRRRLIDSFLATSSGSTHMVLVQDEDDAETQLTFDDPRIGSLLFDREGEAGCSRQLNYGAVLAAKHCRYVGSVNDDHVFRTIGWDRMMMDALGDKVGVCCANDLLKFGRFPTAMIMSSIIIRALGRMHPPYKHGSPDNAWKMIAQGLGCYIYLPDVIIEHMHPIVGKGKLDSVYTEAHKHDDADLAIGKEWERTGLAKDIQAIRERVALEDRRQPAQA